MINSEVIRDQSMREGYEQRKAEYEIRIKEWITKDDLKAYKGLNLSEIRKILGNEKLPIAEVPIEAANFFGIEDTTVYSSGAYFIDHVVNHHDELSLDDYIGWLIRYQISPISTYQKNMEILGLYSLKR